MEIPKTPDGKPDWEKIATIDWEKYREEEKEFIEMMGDPDEDYEDE